jgi:hypothetical protein
MAPDPPQSSSTLIGFGVVLTLVGLVGLAIVVVTNPQTNDLTKKDQRVQATEQHPRATIPTLSVLAVALGVISTGLGSSYVRR